MGTDDNVPRGLLEKSVPAPNTSNEYEKAWASSGARPKDIPRFPKSVYGRRGEWVSGDDFLGRKEGEVIGRWGVKKIMSYKEARRFMRALRRSGSGGQVVVGLDDEVEGGLLKVSVPAPNTSKEYIGTWASSGARPKDIPYNPMSVYGRRGEWVSWDDFLGRKEGEVRRGGNKGSKKREAVS